MLRQYMRFRRRFIEDDRDRSLTFFKRRYGTFKAASDLSTLTSARVAVVFESESGRFSAFGTPNASPIIDAFLLGHAPNEFDTNEEHKDKTINLQNELFQLEKDKVMHEKMKKEHMAQIKEIQEKSRMAKYAFGKEEDLNPNELYEMLHELIRIKQDINDFLPILLHDNHVEASSRLRDPSLLQPTWWRSMPSQIVMPPKYSPRDPLEASFQHHPWLSSSDQVLTSSSSLHLNPMMLPSQQVQPKLHQHPLAPQVPPPKEAYPNNYHIHGLDIGGNNSRSFSFSPIFPSPPPQPSSLHTPPSNNGSSAMSLPPQFSSIEHLDSQKLSFNTQNYNPLQPPYKYENAGSTLIHPHESFYGNSLGIDVELGNTICNGGQTSGVHSKGYALSSPLQGAGWARMTSESSSIGESYASGEVGINLGDLNFPWDYLVQELL